MNKKTKKLILRFLLLDFKFTLQDKSTQITLLIVRVASALIMLFSHGVGKLMHFSKIAPNFPDPLHLGSTLSLFLVVGAEFFSAILLALGLFTRWASFSLFFTMMVAAFIVHLPDPFEKKELAVLYGLIFILYTIIGGGKYSLDHLLKKNL